MMELVQEGRLDGDNPSEMTGDDPLERTLNDELAGSEPVESESEDAGKEPPAAEDREQQEPKAGPKSQVRSYVILEEQFFEDDETPYYVELTRVEARNATNALRRAFKTRISDEQEHRLLAIVASQWQIVPVQRSHRQIESVRIG